MIVEAAAEAKDRKYEWTALVGAGLALSVLTISAPAGANLIYDGNPKVAGGVGNSQVVLSLSSPGSSSNEAGAVMPSRCTGDIQNPCKAPANSLRTFASAGVTSAQDVVVYLDAQEPDNSITLNSLTLNVYAASGTSDTALFSASYAGPPSPLDLTVCPGQGNNCVDAFVLDNTEAAQLQTIFNSALRVGLAASFSNATGGPDRLFLSDRQDAGVVDPAPAPMIGGGIPGLLATIGLLFGAETWQRRQKQGSFATA